MHARRTVWLIILLLALLPLGLAACAGGSGSSGFEPVSEDAAITQALTTQACVRSDALTVCPADVAGPPKAPGSIETGVDQSRPVSCTLETATNCNLIVPFMPEGFGPDAVFRVAVRNVDPNGKWRISAAPIPNGTPGAPDFDGAVGVDRPPDTQSTAGHVQLAILVFLHTPPTSFQPVDTLSETGAEFVYVTTQLTLQFNL